MLEATIIGAEKSSTISFKGQVLDLIVTVQNKHITVVERVLHISEMSSEQLCGESEKSALCGDDIEVKQFVFFFNPRIISTV